MKIKIWEYYDQFEPTTEFAKQLKEQSEKLIKDLKNNNCNSKEDPLELPLLRLFISQFPEHDIAQQ